MITLRSVSKVYTVGGQPLSVLDDVSLDIADGEFVAIVWPSGSGKSTLMNIIGMLDMPSAGSYQLDGQEVTTLSDADQTRLRGQKIGFVFQSYNLISRYSVLKQVELPLSYQWVSQADRTARAIDALDQVHLSDKLDSKPSQLSGWQQQRVSIARALVVRPSLILADEPTGALDSVTSRDIIKLFHELNAAGKTIIMITHDNEIAQCAKRIIRVRDGRIVSS